MAVLGGYIGGGPAQSVGDLQASDATRRLASTVMARRLTRAKTATPPATETLPTASEGVMTDSTPGAPTVPWYKKWWVWALVLGGAAAVGTGGYLIYRRRRAAKSTGGLVRW